MKRKSTGFSTPTSAGLVGFQIAQSIGFKGEFRHGGICCRLEIDHGKLILLIPSADWRKTTVLPQIGNLDYRRCVLPDSICFPLLPALSQACR